MTPKECALFTMKLSLSTINQATLGKLFNLFKFYFLIFNTGKIMPTSLNYYENYIR